MIQLDGLTKRFPNGKGIFDLQFEVKRGEVFGFLGPNGAGKSTTIRHLMGLMRPTSGSARMAGLDCWRDASQIQRQVGYLPGEIALIEGLTGKAMLDLIGQMRKMDSLIRREELIERFQLDIKIPIRKMSKGMKQKIGIIIAFMHDPEILILDEPTSGLDPLMQRTFIELILEEKAKGKTILMSSHLFQEIERTCNRIGMIRDGRLVQVTDIQKLRQIQRKAFSITVYETTDLHRLKELGIQISHIEGTTCEVVIQGDLNPLLQALSQVRVRQLDSHSLDLEELFLQYYDQVEEEKA